MSIINSAYSFLMKKEFLKDPVSLDFATQYQQNRALDYAKKEVDSIELVFGQVKNRRVVDIGGGPGLVSIELAKRGADVTWYDISKNYETVANSNIRSAGVDIKTARGLIDEDFLGALGKFDLAICLVCWYYSDNDMKMAAFLKSIITGRGQVYVSCNVGRPSIRKLGKLRSLMYHKYGIKIGHPFPVNGMIKRALESAGFNTVRYVLPSGLDQDDVERTFCVLQS